MATITGYRNHQKDALHDPAIVARWRCSIRSRYPGTENGFDQKRPADDEADGDCQLGKERQRSVATDVGGGDAPILSPRPPR